MLLRKYNILLSGTCRQNRKGWPKEKLCLTKKGTSRGDSKVVYDKVSKVVCCEWLDSKIVRFVSTLGLS